MKFATKASMLTNRVVCTTLKSETFGDERFLTALDAAMRSPKYRIEIIFTPTGEDEDIQSLTLASEDADGEAFNGDSIDG